LSLHQNAMSNLYIEVLIHFSQQFKYLASIGTNQRCIHEEIKGKLYSGNIVFYILSKDKTIKIYKTIILLVVLCGCQTEFLTLRKGHILRVPILYGAIKRN
jgi:hypothetical protein